MKLFCLTLLAIVFTAMAAPVDKPVYNVEEAPQLFEKFIQDHNRQYADENDRQIHYEAFVKSLKTINKLNAESTSATFGINQFADQTEEERNQMRGLLPRKS